MEEISNVLAVISVLGTLSSIFFAVLAFRRNDRGDQKQIGKKEGEVISDIRHIKSSVDRVEKTLDKLEERYNDLDGRLIKVETDIANLAEKIDHRVRTKARYVKGGS
ncbi:MAG TPA: hypothetical protein PLV28_01275 [Bacilli bacterium]|jgi:septal ring factor EnvC (AmiA/AmiB activator)|nr:hypothetical protein [Bacilli bacterium]